MNRFSFCVLLTLVGLLPAKAQQSFQLSKLTVDYQQPQPGQTIVFTDEAQPRFAWQLADAQTTGVVQTAYQIVVTDEAGNTVWNSGRTTSRDNFSIAYQGQALRACTPYKWTVTVWDNHKRQATATSSFETSLLSTTDRDAAWGGAQWIGGAANKPVAGKPDEAVNNCLSFESQYLPVFRLVGTIALDKATKSTRAALVYGANDERLMNANMNILGRANGKNESYVLVELNTTGLDAGDSAAVCIYRVGYTKTDRADVPLATVKIPTDLVSKANRYAAHKIEVIANCGTTKLEIDGKPLKGELHINPMGVGSDFIAFPMVADVGFYAAQGQKAQFGDFIVRNYRLPRHVLAVVPTPGTLSGNLYLATPKAQGLPALRTEFSTQSKPIARARIYATARGAYDLVLNGQPVAGDVYLSPGLTQYNKYHQYQVFDVTSLMRGGQNALGAQLYEGWYTGNQTFSAFNWNYFGDRQSLLLLLDITYADGSHQQVVSRPDTWKYTTEGPVRLGSMFAGEIYDATREMSGWATAGYDDSRWQQAERVDLEGTISHQIDPGMLTWPCPDDYSSMTLRQQYDYPVHQDTVLTAQSLTQVRPGVYIYDMGQNMPGVPRITFRGLKSGTKVKMRFAEVLYPDLPEYSDNVGMVMMENQRAAMEQDEYIARGAAAETFAPRGTYHGFRYIEITGVPSELALSDVQATVLTSATPIATQLETSSNDVNQLFHNTVWSTKANVFSIPTDCPQRNERMGWSGDLSVFSPTMSYLIQGAPFLRKHLRALRDTQLDDGAFASIAPIGGGFGGPLWSSVGIAMPWQSWIQYGDRRALEEHYPAMKRYIECSLNNYIDKKQGFYAGTGGWGDLGDWLGFEVGKNDNSLLFDSYLVYELAIMEKAATALGKTDEAARWKQAREQRAQFIMAHYVDPATGKTVGSGLGEIKMTPFGPNGPKRSGVDIDTQTSYTLLLSFGIAGDDMKPKIASQLVNTVTRRSLGDDGKTYPAYSLMTGFIGTAWIADALTKVGRTDLAYRMLLNKQFPSWLYPVEQGATTIWERLNSYTKTAGFGGNNSMNSFNHYAFGSVTNWVIQHAAGICRDDVTPAFEHFIIAPSPDDNGGLTHARATYQSMQGTIVSGWERHGDGATIYTVAIPANATATLRIPVSKGQKVTCNGKKLKLGKQETSGLNREIGSGNYTIIVK